MHETGSHASASRRTLLLGASSLLLTGCSLRFQDGSHVPGPTATAPSDIPPLQSIRQYLLAAMSKCSQEKTFVKPATATLTLHQQQLTRLDATLKGLEASPASPTHFPTPVSTATSTTPVPTSSAKPHTPSSTTNSSSASATSTSTPPQPTAWTWTEFGWLGLASTFARISSHSRPLALSLAASSIAAAMGTGLTTAWPSEATIPAQGSTELRTAIAPAIAASEWLVAHTHGTDRPPVANNVTWLYAARSMVSASSSPAITSASAPVWAFTSPEDARNMIRKALGNVMAACVSAAQGASTDHDCQGVLFIWTQTVAELSKDGVPLTAFPGLTD